MWLEWMGVMLLQPLVSVEAVLLLAPQHACQRLAHHRSHVRRGVGGCEHAVEGVGLASTRFHRLVEVAPECLPLVLRLTTDTSWSLTTQAQPDSGFYSPA